METHTQFCNVQRFWHNLGYEPVAIEEARDHVGGIWIMASDTRVKYSVIETHPQVVTISLEVGSSKWASSMVYASPIPSSRDQLWSYLENLHARLSIPWLLIGDFNEIILPSEVRGGIFVEVMLLGSPRFWIIVTWWILELRVLILLGIATGMV